MTKIKRVEEETIMKEGKIVAINYRVWYKNGTKRAYFQNQYKVIPMTVLDFILDESNEANTRYQEYDGCIYKYTMYQGEKKSNDINVSNAQEDIEDAIKYGWIKAQETINDTNTNKEEETMKPEVIFSRIREEVESRTERSAWSRGVTAYALDLVDELEEATEGGYFDLSDLEAPKLVDRALLNGAADWNQYSWGGCSLCYDCQIAERLCTPSELKKTRHGERRPNSREEWLDTQARALFQASNRVKKSIRAALKA